MKIKKDVKKNLETKADADAAIVADQPAQVGWKCSKCGSEKIIGLFRVGFYGNYSSVKCLCLKCKARFDIDYNIWIKARDERRLISRG